MGVKGWGAGPGCLRALDGDWEPGCSGALTPWCDLAAGTAAPVDGAFARALGWAGGAPDAGGLVLSSASGGARWWRAGPPAAALRGRLGPRTGLPHWAAPTPRADYFLELQASLCVRRVVPPLAGCSLCLRCRGAGLADASSRPSKGRGAAAANGMAGHCVGPASVRPRTLAPMTPWASMRVGMFGSARPPLPGRGMDEASALCPAALPPIALRRAVRPTTPP